MPLPEKRDHRISLPEASALTRGHRAVAAAGEPKGHFFHREAYESILSQPGCAGIRLYHGKDKGGEKHVVMVGVDGEGADMTSGAIMQLGFPCPPYCDAKSTLQG